MDWLGSRDVVVRVDLSAPVAEKHLEVMTSAATDLTNDRKSVRVYGAADGTKSVFAEFSMVGIRQDNAAGVVMDRFSTFMPDYSDQTVWFPTRKRKRTQKRQRSKTP